MTNEKRPRWAPDSWVKVILIVSLSISLVAINIAIVIRAIFREDIDSAIMLEIFSGYIGLFGVVVGYVLGKSKGE